MTGCLRSGDKGIALQCARAFDKIRIVKRGCEAVLEVGHRLQRPAVSPAKEG